MSSDSPDTTPQRPAFHVHDRVDPRIRGRLARTLTTEWIRLCQMDELAAATLRRWAAAEPALAGHSDLASLVDRVDQGSHQVKDEILLALVRLAQAGHQLAGRVVLQAMLPKLTLMAVRQSEPIRTVLNDEDRCASMVAAFWEVLVAYPVDRRPRRVAANLALDTLRRFLRDAATTFSEGYGDDVLTTAGPPQLTGPAPGSDTPICEVDLCTVLADALDQGTIGKDEARLLARVYLRTRDDPTPEEVAAELGISWHALRKRLSRLKDRLATAETVS